MEKRRGRKIKYSAWIIAAGIFLLNTLLIFRERVQPIKAEHPAALGWFAALTVGLLLLAAMGYVLLFRLKWSLHRVFLAGGMLLGVLYMFYLPPYSAPDEHAHFSNAYYYSNLLMGKEGAKSDGKTWIRRGDNTYKDKEHRYPGLAAYEQISEELFRKDRSRDMVAFRTKASAATPFVAYVPQIAGITLARILRLGNVPLLFMGRLFALVFYLSFAYFGIKYMPFGKTVLFVTALLPMALEEAASFSYDSTVLGLSFFFIGYCLHLAYGKSEVIRKDWAVLAVVMAVLAPIKVVYILMAPLCFLIPIEKPSGKKLQWALCGGVVASGGAGLLAVRLAALANYLTRASSSAAYTGMPGYTTGYLLGHLDESVKLFFNTLKQQGGVFLDTMVGGKLGWLEIPVNAVVIWLFLIVLMLSALCARRERVFLSPRAKLLITVIIAGVTASTMLVLCLTWTVIGSPYIEGIQGRYFLPVLPLGALLLRSRNLVFRRTMRRELAMAALMLHIPVLWTVFEIIASR